MNEVNQQQDDKINKTKYNNDLEQYNINNTEEAQSKTKATNNHHKHHHHYSKLRDGVAQFAVMFQKPHLRNSLLVYSIQFSILFG